MSRIARFAGLAALSVWAAVAVAQDVPVEKYTLPNGMKVILRQDRTLPIATVNIWYSVGSKDEPARRSGFAHLFEHLMFMGTKRVPTGQFDAIMEEAGGRNNGSTTEDRTNYYSIGPSNLLKTLLWLDADRLEDLGKTMDIKKLDLQRDVVKNERRQNTENTPYGKAYEAINALMFPASHPYGHSVIGSMDDLSAASLEDVQNFFATFYVPNNASLVVAGDFDPAEIKKTIAEYFGSLPRRNDPIRPDVPSAALTSERRVTMVDQVQLPKTIMVWHAPAAYQSGDAEIRIAGEVLTNGLSSRLQKRLVVDEKIATEVSYYQDARKHGSLFMLEATAAPDVPLEKIEKAIDEEIAKLKASGVKAEEMRRIVSQIEFGTLSSLQSLEQVADKLNEYEFYLGEPNAFKKVLDTFRNATPNGVRDVARKTLDPNARLVLRVVPEGEAEEVQNPRDARPDLAAEKAFTPQPPREFTLSNGIRVQYWNRPELPLMAVTTAFRGGAALDPQDKVGRASMTASMLDEGAGSRDAASFQNALDEIGATFGASSDQLSTSASLLVLSSNFDRGLSLYSDALLRPRFSADAFERLQRLSIAGLQQAQDDPATVAGRVGMREFFGAQHPYGRPVGGTIASLGTLKPEDLRTHHAVVFQPQNATLFVAGSLPEGQVRASLEKAFAGWKAGDLKAPIATVPETKKNEALRVVLVDKPGAVQTVIRFVMPAPAYNNPNREALAALGTVLGGSFTSRLNQNLREDKGYTYGAGSRFTFTPDLGYVIANSSVRADVTGESLKEFLKEFQNIRSGDISDAEAGKAASTRRADLISSLGSLQGLLSVAQMYSLVGRPFTGASEDMKTISSISAKELNALAKRAIPLENGVLVLVGDRATILEQIKGLGLPTPVEVKPDF